jgi:hypothetical protein
MRAIRSNPDDVGASVPARARIDHVGTAAHGCPAERSWVAIGKGTTSGRAADPTPTRSSRLRRPSSRPALDANLGDTLPHFQCGVSPSSRGQECPQNTYQLDCQQQIPRGLKPLGMTMRKGGCSAPPGLPLRLAQGVGKNRAGLRTEVVPLISFTTPS